jgi:predicted outer membrane repeat protein
MGPISWRAGRGWVRGAGRRAGVRAGLLAGALLVAQCAGQGTAGAAVAVPCDTAALISAITTANAAGTPQTLNLAPSCTYTLTTPAATGSRGDDGLPIITGTITMIGSNTVIKRSSAQLFRIVEVAHTLALSGVSILGGNAGSNTGGGILSAHGTVSVTSGTIRDNLADNGAGISNDNGHVTLTNSVVRGNSTVPADGGGGGGIYNDGTMSINSSYVINNTANTNGGGIYNELTGVISVSHSILSGNMAAQHGAAFYNGTNGTASFSSSTVQFNTAGVAGGGIFNATCPCSVTLSQTTISYNDPQNCAPSGSVHGCTT